ncbi:Clp protease N-terminal domain-containing protein [Jongsikchunia kroppenstedtii]|uniref:Clp protease N-terminal domain-containing protein n=1 Tax=Jongsikchunia kroppenstedtii TaxID=1121721 RepID=UPI00037EEEAD|nr:Clp protease N-terminal domain-containing protein [Jongsikchunia kroppenstedtii]
MFERFTHENRTTLMFAMEEAHDLGHRELGNDHLLLGMLCNARGTGNEILQELGLTLPDAREASRAFHEATTEAATDDTDAADATVDETVREDREALRAIGIDLDKVRRAVRETFGEDIADGWGKRRGDRRGDGDRGPRGRGRGRGDDEQFEPWGRGRRGHEHRGHEHRGHEHPGGPRRGGPRGRGFEDPRGFPGGFDRGFGDGPFDGPWGGPGRGRRGPASRRGGFRRPRFSSDTRSALAGAVKAAREYDDQQLGPEHLLLGILDTGDAASIAVIESASSTEALRAAVIKRLTPDTSQSA